MPGEDPRTDQELIARCNRGDHGAFEALYHRHKEFVSRIAHRYTRDADLTLDALQNVFAYLSGKFPGFTLTCRMTTFLYPVARHEALALLRARRRGGGAAGWGGGDDDLLADIATPAPSEKGSISPDLVRILGVLPPGHREVVLMRFVDDLSLAEIAEALAIPVGTVKSRLHNALSALRDDPATRRYFLDP